MHTLVATGVDNRTAGVLGSLASISTLRLEYVPERGTLVLLGAGLAALAIARRRMG